MPAKHYDVRCQQRSIPKVVKDWLADFGEERHDHNGAVIRFFSKRSKRSMERAFGRHFVQQNNKYLAAYEVTTTDGKPITAGWRTARIKAH